MQSLALQSAHFDAFCPSQVSSAGSVQISAWTMSLTRVQDVSVHDIHKRKKPRKHYVSQYFCVVLCLVASRPRACKGIQDSIGFWIARCGFQVLYSVVFSCGNSIPDSKDQDSGIHKKNFPGFPCMGQF